MHGILMHGILMHGILMPRHAGAGWHPVETLIDALVVNASHRAGHRLFDVQP